MANTESPLPLYERVAYKNTMQRAMDVVIFFLQICLLTYRFFALKDHGYPWLVAFLCESWFTFMWALCMNTRWNPVEYKTYPEHLPQRYRVSELPPVDMFVTTADPVLEPPIIVVNTVLSLMAVDYPAHKLACYVSDDGASALTFYSLVEASNFAKLWVPFCKKYGVQIRAPFRHFSEEKISRLDEHLLSEYQQERHKMKVEYERLVELIENATRKPMSEDNSFDQFRDFSNIEHGNHPSIVKVIWENMEGLSDELPNLVYISREKRPKHPHHYKAGAMNALARVSGVMTNAPFMLNVDCDMYANNPQIVMHALCLLLGANETESGFVQCPQYFYNGPGEAFRVMQQYTGRGLVGLQGPFYLGTGCFHRRKIIYGAWPEKQEMKRRDLNSADGSFALEDLVKRFGNSVELNESVSRSLSMSMSSSAGRTNLSSLVDAASIVAGCGYDYGTSWGTEIGWMYGSIVEDIITGLKIHSRGWRSIFCTPDPPAFLGCAPSDVPTAMAQQKRWASGLIENLVNKQNPLLATLNENLQFRQCLAYMYAAFYYLTAIPELCYAVLPAYCIITNSFFLPKGLALCIPVALFVIQNLCSLLEFLRTGVSARSWWDAYKMGRINSATAWILGVFSIIIKLLGLSEPVFEVTCKGEAASGSDGDFTFDKSPVFVPATFLSIVHLMALFTALLGLQLPIRGGRKSGIAEMICNIWALLCFWFFIEGLFRKGRHGIPASTIFKSAALALLFLHFCKYTSML